MFQLILDKIRRLFGKTKEPSSLYLVDVLGFSPRDDFYYRLAMTHKSKSYKGVNNERLEFLGDSVLEAIVSKYLYLEYPNRQEGELTHKRSEWVSRTTNNNVAERLNIQSYLRYKNFSMGSQDVLGNTLEAIIGAIFLDYNFDQAYDFFIQRMLPIILQLEQEEGTMKINYKSQLLEWSQRQHVKISYKIVFAPKHGRGQFRAVVALTENDDERIVAEGKGPNKKAAEQEAARLAIEELNI